MCIDGDNRKRAVILTWCYDFGNVNFGQVMQGYALYRICEMQGIDTKVLRYRRLTQDEMAGIKCPDNMSVDEYEIEYRKSTWNMGKQGERFLVFINDNIPRTNMCYSLQDVKDECRDADYIIVGSDQLWNPNYFDEVFCPNYAGEKQVIFSYATGGISVNNPLSERVISEIARRISSFSAVSVRERISAEILSKYTCKNIETVLDPTFVLPIEEWDKVANDRLVDNRYMLCVCYGDVRVQKHILNEVKSKYDLNIVYIVKMDGYYGDFYLDEGMKILCDAGPKEIISLIKYADVVCTDSFHGFVFSVKYGRQVYLLDRPNVPISDASPTRLDDVCERLGIGNRWLHAKKNLCKIGDIDYQKVNEKLEEEIDLSLKYISGVIKSYCDRDLSNQ